MMQLKTLLAIPVVALAAAITGCHGPGGAFISYTGASTTIESTEVRPATVEIIDLRNQQVVFRMDVPPGKQLTFDFLPGEGDDPVYSPDLMRYQVWDNGTNTGKLHNSLTVPTSSARRLDVYYRSGPEYLGAMPARDLRTDELPDRPTWWTPQGGEMPAQDAGVTNYDK